MVNKKILLGHGSGGRLMHGLIKDLFLKKLGNPILKELTDSALIETSENPFFNARQRRLHVDSRRLSRRDISRPSALHLRKSAFKRPFQSSLINHKARIAFTTDSFVVSPLFFAGGDIGKLAVCGTVNDLVMQAAIPEYLSLAFIIEEGLDYAVLEKIVDSISKNAKRAGVYFVTGDIKVVEKGACDKIFINTSGIGRVMENKRLSVKNIKATDLIIVTGQIAQHGLAVLSRRKELELGFNIKSDCAALGDLIIPVLSKTEAIKFMRDPTRGGLATTLTEIAENSGLGIVINEKNIPISTAAKAACELLGIDPLYIACEGSAIVVVEKAGAKKVLSLLRRHSLGRHAQIIGSIVKQPKGRLILNTILGTRRVVDMLTSEPLPRIC